MTGYAATRGARFPDATTFPESAHTTAGQLPGVEAEAPAAPKRKKK